MGLGHLLYLCMLLSPGLVLSIVPFALVRNVPSAEGAVLLLIVAADIPLQLYQYGTIYPDPIRFLVYFLVNFVASRAVRDIIRHFRR